MEDVLKKVYTLINFEYENVEKLPLKLYKKKVYNRKENFKRKMKKCHTEDKDDIDYQMCMLVYEGFTDLKPKKENLEIYWKEKCNLYQSVLQEAENRDLIFYRDHGYVFGSVSNEHYDTLYGENQELKKQIEKLQKKENDKLMTIRNILKISIPKTFIKTETIEPKQSFMFKIKKAFN